MPFITMKRKGEIILMMATTTKVMMPDEAHHSDVAFKCYETGMQQCPVLKSITKVTD